MALPLEIHEDGGIRVGTVDSDELQHIARIGQARYLASDAAKRGRSVDVVGAVHSAAAGPIIDMVRETGAQFEVTETTPAPWADRMSSIQFSAFHGLADFVEDLIARGASPDGDGERSPYRLAMKHGHVPVMRALRAAGVEDPVKGRRPEGASDDVIVLRHFVTGRGRLIALSASLIPALAGAVGLLVTGDTAPLLTGAVVTVAAMALFALYASLVIAPRIAIDGTSVYTGNPLRWKGPVDLRSLAALAYQPPARRVAAAFYLLQPQAGTRTLLIALSFFDRDVREQLKGIENLRSFIVRFGRLYQPGVARFVGSCAEGSSAIVADGARAFIAKQGGFRASD